MTTKICAPYILACLLASAAANSVNAQSLIGTHEFGVGGSGGNSGNNTIYTEGGFGFSVIKFIPNSFLITDICLACATFQLPVERYSGTFDFDYGNSINFGQFAALLTNNEDDIFGAAGFKFDAQGMMSNLGLGASPESLYFGDVWGPEVEVTSIRIILDQFTFLQTGPSLSYTVRGIWEIYGIGAAEVDPLPPFPPFVPEAIPEPSTYALLLVGLAATIAIARRRRAKAVTRSTSFLLRP